MKFVALLLMASAFLYADDKPKDQIIPIAGVKSLGSFNVQKRAMTYDDGVKPDDVIYSLLAANSDLQNKLNACQNPPKKAGNKK